MKPYALFLLLFFSNIVHAQWFESSASTVVVNGNWQEARAQALQQAVKNALLYSGGTISSLQQLNNGVLVENRLLLNSEGEIKALIISDEQKRGNRLHINIKVDIQSVNKSCYGEKFAKSLALTRFKLNTPEQAVDGNIFSLHRLVSKTLFNQLQLSSQHFDVRQFIDSPINLGVQYQDNTQSDILHTLATSSDSQFLVYGEINDISVQFASKNSLDYWLNNPTRHFYLTVYLYDALQGVLIANKQYRTQAAWQYGQHETADLNSKTFWQKDYGQAIIALLNEVSTDLEAQLQCVSPTAKVVSVASDSIKINLGHNNGIKQGASLSLLYASNHKDQFGIERSSTSQYQGEMIVSEVNNNSAILRTEDKFPLGNIQINDLARIK